MRKEVFMAGIGGQGVLLAGQVLAQAAMVAGWEVSWFPINDPEVRGGRSTCTVVMADDEVGSPVVGHPAAMILMDRIAVDNHLHRTQSAGLVVLNSSLASAESNRDDIRIVAIPANDIAAEVGSERSVNMVLLGGYVVANELLGLETVEEALAQVIPERHHAMIPVNQAALQRGAAWAAGQISRGESPC